MLLYLLGALFLFLGVFLVRNRARLIPGIPAPPNHWLLGSLPEILKNKHRFFQWHVDMAEKFKKTWHVSVPGRKVAFKIVSADCIAHILKNNDNYVKLITAHDRSIWKEFGLGATFVAEDQAWRDLRRTGSHLFSANVMKNRAEECFVKHGHILVKKLEGLHGKELDVQDLFFNYTMDAFCEIAFGVSLGGLESKQKPAFSTSFDRIMERIFSRRIEPEFLCRLKMFLRTKDERQMAEDYQCIRDTLLPIIAQRREAAAKGENAIISTKFFSGDLVSLLMEDAIKVGKGELSDVQLLEETLTFILGGRDTTASALTSVCQLLSSHPEVVTKMRAEIAEKVGSNLPTHENVAELAYCEAVFMESLRLFPAGPMNYRKSRQDDTLPDGTFVPAGCEVQWATWVMGRKAELYPDPLTFKPERWLEGKPPALHSFEMPVFNAGPRTCLGRLMSVFEARIIMVMVMPRFDFKLVPGQRLDDYSLGLTLVREHGQLMTVSSIQK